MKEHGPRGGVRHSVDRWTPIAKRLGERLRQMKEARCPICGGPKAAHPDDEPRPCLQCRMNGRA